MIAWFRFLILSIILFNPLAAFEDPIVTRKVEGGFKEVSNSVREAIIGKGINIAHVLSASQMLTRTESAFGYKSGVYVNAEIYEFCSARISHKLSRAHPDNIVLCPFTISVYTVRDEPGMVRLSYLIPAGRPGTEEIIEEVVALIESILEDATW